MRYIGLLLASVIVIVTVAFFTFNKSQQSRKSAVQKSADIKILPSNTPTPLPTPAAITVDPQLQMNRHVAAIHKIIQAEVAPHEFIIERGIDDRLVNETVLGFQKTFPPENSEVASDVLTALYSYFNTNGFQNEQFEDIDSGRFNIHAGFTKAKIRCILHNYQNSGISEITINIGCNQFN